MLVMGAGAVLALFIADKAIFGPLVNAWKSRQDHISELRSAVKTDSGLVKNKDVYLAKWRKMESNALPNDRSEAEGKVLDAVERWTQDSRIKIDRRQPQWRDSDSG